MDGVLARSRSHQFPRILVFVFLLTLSTQAIRPMVSYRALELGANAVDLGIVASSFAVLSLLMAVPVGRRVDRWGEPRIIVSGVAVVALTAVGLLWIDTIWALALSQAVLGLGQMMSVIGNQALVASAGDPRRRDARFGAFSVVVSLGQLAGPAAAGLIAGGGTPDEATLSTSADTQLVFLAAAGAASLALVIALSLLRGARGGLPVDTAVKVERTRSTEALRRVLGVPSMPHAMVASLTVVSSINILTAYLPAYGEAHGLSVQTVGFLLSARAAASVLSRLVMVPLISLLGRRHLLLMSVMLPAGALAAFPLLPSLPWYYAAMAVIGLGLGLGQPVTLSWVAGAAPRELRGTALGLRVSGNRLGQTVLPAVVGLVAGTTALGAVFYSLSAILAVSGTIVLRACFDHGDAAPPTDPRAG